MKNIVGRYSMRTLSEIKMGGLIIIIKVHHWQVVYGIEYYSRWRREYFSITEE